MSACPLPAVAAERDRALIAKERAREQDLRRFTRNLAAIIGVGVLISWWLVEFTDFFPTIGGLLGLGGIFAWIAFLANLITEDRKKELQKVVEERILTPPTTAAYAMFALILFGIFAALQGTIIVTGAPDGPRRTVDIRADGQVIGSIDVAPNTTVKLSVFLRPASEIVAKTPGLPERRVVLDSFSRQNLAIPYSFVNQPVILTHLPDSLTTSAKGAVLKVSLRRNGKWENYGTVEGSGYDGQSVWIGSSADVAVPATVVEQWRDRGEPIRSRWTSPRAIGADKPLQVGDVIRVCVMTPEDPLHGAMASGETVVISEKQQPFPQQLGLEEGSSAGRCP